MNHDYYLGIGQEKVIPFLRELYSNQTTLFMCVGQEEVIEYSQETSESIFQEEIFKSQQYQKYEEDRKQGKPIEYLDFQPSSG